MRKKIEYYIVLSFVKIVRYLPESFTYATLHFFGWFLFKILKKRRNLAIDNLSYAFKDKNNEELTLIIKNNFLSLARTLAETLLVASGKRQMDDFLENKEEAMSKYFEVTKTKKEGQGIVFMGAHFGNWEILANYFAQKGFPMTVVGREGDNELIEQNITTPFRQRYGNKNVYKSEAMLAMVKTLKKGGSVGLLIDQKAGTTNSVITTFFGRECSTTVSVATMKLRYNPLIIPSFCKRNENGKLEFIVFDPIEYKADEIENKEEKIKEITQRYNDIFQEVVVKYPEQWFWMHNRWKIQ